MYEPKITRAELIIWSAIVIALICIVFLFFTRDRYHYSPMQPIHDYKKSRPIMKDPGTADLPFLRHDPRPQDVPVIKKEGDEAGLKKEE